MATATTNAARSRSRFCEILRGAAISKEDFLNLHLMEQSLYEGLLGLMLPRLLGEGGVPLDGPVRAGHELKLREVSANYMRLQHACAQVLAALNRASVPVLCMRGLTLTERYYGEQAPLRPISDIDLLLTKGRMLEAKQALWDIGFRPDPVYRNIYARGDITLDLHYEPIGYERIDAWRHITSLRTEAFFEHAQRGRLLGEDALLLPPAVELPYLCFHALKHSFERLIWLYDISLVARAIDADEGWDEAVAVIAAYGLERPCYYALSYAKAHLEAPVPEAVLASIWPDMGMIERGLYRRHMQHEVIPYLAERLFARMQPDLAHRVAFWRESIYPRYEVRQQIAGSGCVKCNFIRKRLRQLLKGGWLLWRELFSWLRPAGRAN